MKIKIVIWSREKTYSIYADDKTNEFTFGLESKKDGVKTFVRQAIDIVKDWPDRMEDTNMMDGICYKIAYENENGSRQIVGSNKVPETFSSLLYLIKKNEINNENFLLEEEKHKKELYSEIFLFISILFITCILVSNILASKIITIFGISMTGGVLVFPITYIIGDVLTEIYGYKKSKKIIIYGFICNLIMVILFFIAKLQNELNERLNI